MTNTSTETETEEWQRLRSQIVILKKARGTHRKYQPTLLPSMESRCFRAC